MWAIFNVLIEFVTKLLLFWPLGMQDPSPASGIEPAPAALEGKVITTGLPGMSLKQVSNCVSKALEHASEVLVQGTTSYQVTFFLQGKLCHLPQLNENFFICFWNQGEYVRSPFFHLLG